MTDLDIIKEIEKILDIKLKKIHEFDYSSGGLILNTQGRVTRLDLVYCTIKNIEKIIFYLKELKSLTHLDLSGNQISDISMIRDLPNLTILNLGGNQISDISPLKELMRLSELNLSWNQISDVSPLGNLLNFPKLANLHLAYNQISDISPIMELFKKDDIKIYLNNNPLKTPPIKIVQQGKEAIRNYFLQLEKEKFKTEYLFEAKLLVIGEGGTGKTTFSRKMQKQNLPIQSNGQLRFLAKCRIFLYYQSDVVII